MVWTFGAQVLAAWPGLMAPCPARARSNEQHFSVQNISDPSQCQYFGSQSNYFHLATQMNLKAHFKSKHKHVKIMTARKFPEKANVNNKGY